MLQPRAPGQSDAPVTEADGKVRLAWLAASQPRNVTDVEKQNPISGIGLLVTPPGVEASPQDPRSRRCLSLAM